MKGRLSLDDTGESHEPEVDPTDKGVIADIDLGLHRHFGAASAPENPGLQSAFRAASIAGSGSGELAGDAAPVATSSGETLRQSGEIRGREEVAGKAVVERPFGLGGMEDGGEVEDGEGWGRDREAAVHEDLVHG